MDQLPLPGVPLDWRLWNHRIEWKGWTINLSMTGDDIIAPITFDWTAIKWKQPMVNGFGISAGRLGAEKEYSSAPAALNQAKEAISMYEDGWRGRMQ